MRFAAVLAIVTKFAEERSGSPAPFPTNITQVTEQGRREVALAASICGT